MSNSRKKDIWHSFAGKFLISLCATGIIVCVFMIGLFIYSERDQKAQETLSEQQNASKNQEDVKISQEISKIENITEPEVPEAVVSENETVDLEEDNEKSGSVSGKAVLTFGGDICFDENYSNMYTLEQRDGDIKKCFSDDILQAMKESDVFMVNNEFTYTTRGEPLPEKAFTFRSNPKNINLLKDMGVDLVSLANNHAYDYGEVSLLDSIDALESAEMPLVGAGKNLEEARKPYYTTINGIKIAIVAATQIERLENPDTKGATENNAGVFRCFTETELSHLLETVKLAKTESDFVVVYIHWGTENTDELDWAQTYQAPKLAEAGADAIIGGHTHCLQQIDVVKGVPVIYSIGNFWFNSRKYDNGLVRLTFTKEELESFEFLPGIQENCSTSLALGVEKDRIIQYMRSISPNVTIEDSGLIRY